MILVLGEATRSCRVNEPKPLVAPVIKTTFCDFGGSILFLLWRKRRQKRLPMVKLPKLGLSRCPSN